MNYKLKISLLAPTLLGSIMLGADVSTYEGTKIADQTIVKSETIQIKELNNVVEATLPWKDEVGLKLKYNMGEPNTSEKLSDIRDVQVLVNETADGVKVDLILNEKPKTNTFCYTVEGYENYDFFYQPPLTQQEIDMGAVRPEEIVGSYAVYHKTKVNHREGGVNYETGKVAHIPYPYIWEVGNELNKIRAEDFTYANGQLCVIVPQSFLDKAIYPVRIDPTFGYTGTGASTASIENTIIAGRFSISENGTGDSVTFQSTVTTETKATKCNVYQDEGGELDVDVAALTNGETEERTVGTGALNAETFNFNSAPTFVSGTFYRPACWSFNGAGSHTIRYDLSITDASGYNRGLTYGAWPDPSGTLTRTDDARISIYVTYTATAAVASPGVIDDFIIIQ